MQLCLRLRIKHMQPKDPHLAMTMINVVDAQESQGKCGADVEGTLVRALDIYSANYGGTDTRVEALKMRLHNLLARRLQQQQQQQRDADED